MFEIRLQDVKAFRLDMKTRFPFGYGIASMTEVPHLFLIADVEINGRMKQGLSADGLPPKWFTKNPDTTFEEDDLPEMLRSIRRAIDTATEIGKKSGFFEWWRELYGGQQAWAADTERAPLLAGLGASLIERAVLDALCRSQQVTLFRAVHDNLLGVDFAAIRPELKLVEPRDLIPSAPLSKVFLRHTIGLTDPITGDELENLERPLDALPFTLEENIRTYGLQYFKIKLSGQLERDRERLQNMAKVINRDVGAAARVTLDGNENFSSIAEFRDAWETFSESSDLKALFRQSLLFVEQPVRRAASLDDEVSEQLQAWTNAPPMIIDESDAEISSLPRALSLGYSGTSHKNCKGIMKGLMAAATLRQAQLARRDRNAIALPLILSAEDLGNVGPVALLQDLAAVAMLGIAHVERNGHHYFAGLSMFPQALQQEMLTHHGDLYYPSADGFAALNPEAGQLNLASINEAPFGLKPMFDLSSFEEWSF